MIPLAGHSVSPCLMLASTGMPLRGLAPDEAHWKVTQAARSHLQQVPCHPPGEEPAAEAQEDCARGWLHNPSDQSPLQKDQPAALTGPACSLQARAPSGLGAGPRGLPGQVMQTMPLQPPRLLRQHDRLQPPFRPITENQMDEQGEESIVGRPNRVLQQVSEQYLRQMQTRDQPALASLRTVAKWSSFVSRSKSSSLKGVALAGRLLLAHARSPEPLSHASERTVVYTFLRDPAWVPIFFELAVRCQEQMASRLGVHSPAEAQDDTQVAAVRRALNPRFACAKAQCFSSGISPSRPSMYVMEAVPAMAPVEAQSDEEPGLPASPQMHRAWIPSMQTLDSLPEWTDRRQMADDYGVKTLDSIASYGDLAGVTGLQTLDSLPDMTAANEITYLRTADSLPEIMQVMGPPSSFLGRTASAAMPMTGIHHGLPSVYRPEGAPPVANGAWLPL
uniref:Uncharacterized protein n=1 Tax=Pyrodinium bahamense TaxID=73915 RepID=A0A7S0A928_9DINO